MANYIVKSTVKLADGLHDPDTVITLASQSDFDGLGITEKDLQCLLDLGAIEKPVELEAASIELEVEDPAPEPAPKATNAKAAE
jgi:hypothetical protein